MALEAVNAEHALLGSILQDNRLFYEAAQHVQARDFADARLGSVWDGIGVEVAKGGMVDVITASGFFPAWGVRGLDAAAPWEWQGASGGIALYASDYAKQVAKDGARRFGLEVLGMGLESIRESGEDPEAVLGSVTRSIQERGSEGRQQIEAVSLGELLKQEESYDWVIEGLLERQDRFVLTAHEGGGKSTMARQMLILPGAGLHPFTFEKIPPVRSLVIDAENTAKQWKRHVGWMAWQAQLQGGVDPTENVMIATPGPMQIADPRVQGQIHRLIDKHKPELLFIGPIYQLATKINSDEDVAPVIAALNGIRARGVAMVIEAHAGHATDGSGTRSVRPRGSSALMGWPEFGFGIRASEEVGVYDFIPWRGQREQRSWPVRLRRGDKEMAEFPWVPMF